MCGIVGKIRTNQGRLDVDSTAKEVKRMLAYIKHRGPDESGFFVDKSVALGNVRLKVNDLTTGQQPMSTEDGRWWISFNGEVYNFKSVREELTVLGHQFESTTDTEVVLRAWIEWGVESVLRLNGGFAFAIYDRKHSRVFLVRDRFGKRPLFVATQGSSLSFASEMKAFLGLDGFSFEWDNEVLADLFSCWVPVGEQCPFVGIKQVLPGEIWEIQSDKIKKSSYAQFSTSKQRRSDAAENMPETVHRNLRASVGLRLESDVDVGVLVSGGLDSSILCSLVREIHSDHLKGFSLGFENSEFDESSMQDELISSLNIDHYRLMISEKDIWEAFPEAVWHSEIPTFRTAFVPMFLLSREISRQGIKVVLSGEGADEVFFGYNIFKEARLRSQWENLSQEDRAQHLKRMYSYLPHFNNANLSAIQARFAKVIAKPENWDFSHRMRFDNSKFSLRLLTVQPPAVSGLEKLMTRYRAQELPVMERAQWLEFHTLLQGYLLSTQGDRMSFAHGVEPRNPFLDPRVVDFANSIPVSEHLSDDMDEKRLLKSAFGSDIPSSILERPKQPYRAPSLHTVLNGAESKTDWVDYCLHEEQLGQIPSINSDFASKLLAKLRRSSAISPREGHALNLLMSLSVLQQQFLGRELRPSAARIESFEVQRIVSS